MGIRRIVNGALVALLAGLLAVVAVPRPAAADGPVYLELLWIRCQDTSHGEWGSDEIWVDIVGAPAGYFEDFDATELRTFVPGSIFHPKQQFTGDTLYVDVWEKDDGNAPPSNWDHQGLFVVNRNLVDTGEHEGYAFLDGQYIVRYRVTSS